MTLSLVANYASRARRLELVSLINGGLINRPIRHCPDAARRRRDYLLIAIVAAY